MEAALKGSREIGFTIVSMTISLAAVFIPVLFMGGILGRLLPRVRRHHRRGDPGLRLRLAHRSRPMLCSRFLKPHAAARQHGRLYQLHPSASSTACCASTSRTLRVVARATAA